MKQTVISIYFTVTLWNFNEFAKRAFRKGRNFRDRGPTTWRYEDRLYICDTFPNHGFPRAVYVDLYTWITWICFFDAWQQNLPNGGFIVIYGGTKYKHHAAIRSASRLPCFSAMLNGPPGLPNFMGPLQRMMGYGMPYLNQTVETVDRAADFWRWLHETSWGLRSTNAGVTKAQTTTNFPNKPWPSSYSVVGISYRQWFLRVWGMAS